MDRIGLAQDRDRWRTLVSAGDPKCAQPPCKALTVLSLA